MLEHQLDGERRRNKLDFSNMDDKIRSEYAKRLANLINPGDIFTRANS